MTASNLRRFFAIAFCLAALALIGRTLAQSAPPTFVYYAGNTSGWDVVKTEDEAEARYLEIYQRQRPASNNPICFRFYRTAYSAGPFVEAKMVNGRLQIGDCGWGPYPHNGKIFSTVMSIQCGRFYDQGQCAALLGGGSAFSAGPPCAEKNSDGTPVCGNPINVSTGNKFQVETDIVIPGSPLLTLTRTYNSQVQRATSATVGSYWRTSFDYSLGFLGASKFALNRPDGSVYQFDGLVAADPLTPGALDYVLDTAGQVIGYVFTTRDGVIETYDRVGRITNIVQPEGGSLTFTYSGADKPRPASVTDNFGRSLAFVYGDRNRLTSVTTPSGAVYTYAYTASSNDYLSKRTNPDGTFKTYLYSEVGRFVTQQPGLLTGIVDETGKRVGSYSYDATGRAYESGGALGLNKVTVAYDTDSAAVTNALGAVETFQFVTVNGVRRISTKTTTCPNGSCAAPGVEQYAYNDRGNMSEIVNAAGVKTCRGFEPGTDLLNRIVTGMDAAASCASALASPPAVMPAQTTTVEWNLGLRKPLRVVTPAALETFTYDSAGRLETYKREATNGNGTGSEGFSVATSGPARQVQYAYNAAGQVTAVDGARTDVSDITTFGYNTAGNLYQVVSPTGRTTSFTAHDAEGRPLQGTLPNGAAASWTYDPLGRQLTETVAGEASGATYFSNGLLQTQTAPSGEQRTFAYDAANRLLSVQNQRGQRVEFDSNALGAPTATRVKAAAGAITRETTLGYDALGRVLSLTGQAPGNPLESLLRQ